MMMQMKLELYTTIWKNDLNILTWYMGLYDTKKCPGGLTPNAYDNDKMQMIRAQ